MSLPQVRAGELKALAVASAKHVVALATTSALAGTLPGVEAWFGIVAPAKTPSVIAEGVAGGVKLD